MKPFAKDQFEKAIKSRLAYAREHAKATSGSIRREWKAEVDILRKVLRDFASAQEEGAVWNDKHGDWGK